MSYPYHSTEKWDVHTHTTLSPETYERLERFTAYDKFVRIRAHKTKPCCAEMVNSKGEVQRVIEDDAYNGTTRLKACDHHGVTTQVLSPTPMMIPDYVDNAHDSAEICKILNDDNARLVDEHPDRFVAIAALPMMHIDEAVKEIERVKKLGMHGIEVNSNISGMDLDDKKLFPIFEAAADMNMGIFVHPWGGFMSPTEETLEKRMHANLNWRPWLIGMPQETALAFESMFRGRVHERLPNLRVLYAHGGGAFPALLGRLEHGAYCRPDLFETYFENSAHKTPYDMLLNCGVYTDTLTHNPWALKMIVDLFGSSRIAVGSDYPYPLGEVDPFDAQTLQDPKGNKAPYSKGKEIAPGHMVEHLPSCSADMDKAWAHFNWLTESNADGTRDLPILSQTQKDNMLHLTAKKWLGYEGDTS